MLAPIANKSIPWGKHLQIINESTQHQGAAKTVRRRHDSLPFVLSYHSIESMPTRLGPNTSPAPAWSHGHPRLARHQKYHRHQRHLSGPCTTARPARVPSGPLSAPGDYQKQARPGCAGNRGGLSSILGGVSRPHGSPFSPGAIPRSGQSRPRGWPAPWRMRAAHIRGHQTHPR